MRTVPVLFRIPLSGALLVALVACSDGKADRSGASSDARVVVTTNILGDVVRNLVGDDVELEIIMPPNSDPHDFAPSAQQAAAMREADVLVVNGLGFEESLLDTIKAAEDDGVVVVAAADAIEPLASEDEDPHLFTDPARMRAAAELMAAELSEQIPELDTPAHRERAEAYLADLDDLDAEVESILADIAPEQRLLLTNHEVFGYFADRYDFEVLGAIIPGGSTLAEPSAAELADLVEEIDEHALPAIFADTSSPSRLADALAAEGVDVEVVELFSESLGEAESGADTYIGMVRTNAERIAAALG